MNKIKRLSSILALAITLTLSKNANAQITSNYYDFIPPTPNMTELSRSCYIPVSYYTGIPDINIPLGQLNCGSISVPISISYYAGGIKVDQVASNLGLGWSLNAGGMISQTVCKEDDLSNPNIRYVLSEEDIKSKRHLSQDEMLSLCMPEKDCAPDIFSYNFMGHSGQFVMDKDQKFYDIHGKHDLDIKYSNHAFTITDLYGNKFTFSNIETCETCTQFYNCSFSQNKLYQARNDARRHNIPTGYYLTKIQDCSETYTINFYYTEEYFTIEKRLEGNLYFDVQTAIENESNGWKEFGLLSQHSSEGTHSAYIPEGNFSQSNITYKALRLCRIETSTGESCNVTYSDSERKDLPGSKAIKGISINSLLQIPSKWKFNCDYFESDTKTQDGGKGYLNYRLKLKGIDRISNDDKKKLSYDFLYYGESQDEPKLPYRNSFKGQDFWGYCNGSVNNSDATKICNIFPYIKDLNFQDNETINMSGVSGYPSGKPVFTFTLGSSHEVNGSYAQAFSLKSIHYPTGKKTYFYYEPNDYYYAGSRIVGQNYAGGLRIKEIQNYDYAGNTLSQKYKYTQTNSVGYDISTGVLTNIPMNITQRPLQLLNSKNGNEEYDIFLKMSSSSFNPAYTISGDYLGYEEVTETTTEGKTVYHFTSSRNASQNYEVTLMMQWGEDYNEKQTYTPYPATCKNNHGLGFLYEPTPNGFCGKFWRRGLIDSKQIFDSNNKLLLSEKYTYTDTLYRNIYGIEPFKLFSGSQIGSSTPSSTKDYIFATMYKIPIGKSTKASCTTIEYRENTPMRNEQHFTYNEYDLPTMTVKRNNERDSTIFTQSYSSDLKYGIFPEMVAKHILAYPIETVVNHNGNAYDLNLKTFELRQGMFLPKGDYTVSLCHPTSISRYNGREKDCHYTTPNYEVTDFDNYGRVLCTKDRNHLCHVFAWDLAGRLILHIENATLQDVLSFCPQITNGQITDEQICQLRNNLTNASVISYKYDNGCLSSIINPRGIETYYVYDGFGRLIEERDHNQNIIKSYQYKYASEHENQ